MPHKHRHHRRNHDLQIGHGEFVRAVGVPIAYAAEIDPVPRNIDHFWITIELEKAERIRIALSTHSRRNAAAGFDPRLRVGVITSTWETLPARGLVQCAGLDYREIEAANPVAFIEYERPALEGLLTDKTSRARLIEVWGEFFLRKELGIHQVHSRRASCSVLKDEIGRDGAIRFYYGNAMAEMVLFKYCGQE